MGSALQLAVFSPGSWSPAEILPSNPQGLLRLLWDRFLLKSSLNSTAAHTIEWQLLLCLFQSICWAFDAWQGVKLYVRLRHWVFISPHMDKGRKQESPHIEGSHRTPPVSSLGPHSQHQSGARTLPLLLRKKVHSFAGLFLCLANSSSSSIGWALIQFFLCWVQRARSGLWYQWGEEEVSALVPVQSSCLVVVADFFRSLI